ncbi:AIR synthase related protein, partial [Sulfuricurvum sp.]|uniref:AIR synthase related protein n=1 Tax=Sulfuricurvum sp. TaxID=2025608 RepID=UPI00262DE454
MTKTITLAQGNGGEENNELIKKVFYKAFKNEILERSEDAAVIGNLAMTTDSFTVSPLFFAGADIGKLAVCGTCNDLAMMGAQPKYLTCSVIIEEGFEVESLERIVESMRSELSINGAVVVSGDTKVVPKGSVDKIFINTTGLGEIVQSGISSNNVSEEDVILINRDIGCHGA